MSKASYAEVLAPIFAACASWGVGAQHMVVLHGSRVEGFANRSSDVDFWVVSPPGESPLLLPVFVWSSDYQLQPESLSWDSLAHLADKINGVSSASSDDVMALPARDIDSYYRFATSISIANSDGAAELRKRFDANHCAAILARRTGTAASTEIEKAVVFSQAGDELQEYLCLRRAVECAVDSFLARYGEAFPNSKWRFEKLLRRFGKESPIYKQAWNLKTRGADRPFTAYREACVDFVRSLAEEYPPRRLSLAHLTSGSLFRLATQDYLLLPSTAVYALSAHAALIWNMTDGSKGLDDVVDGVMTATDRDYASAKTIVFQHLNELRAHGLMDLMPLVD